ncbi:sarcosine oxidase subunit delta [Phaeobacter sp. C3_T13_0]|uniref:sarcosine oxidase subunit delta n=1 Tax=Phaeobacter cretensis TaxID=3342641 RepID=UPI0039BD6263
MRITCPICGERDRREFYYRGAAVSAPAEGAGDEAWHGYLHLRDNPAGPVEEWWYHQHGCGSWVKVRRDTTSHEILAVQLAATQGGL